MESNKRHYTTIRISYDDYEWLMENRGGGSVRKKVSELIQREKNELNEVYLKKLEKIKEQQGIKFATAEEFDAYFSE